MSNCFKDELAVGLAAVRAAAKICQIVQSNITAESLEKKDNSPVTIADFASQAVICRTLGEAFPNDAIIAEEDSLALHQPENQPFLHQIHDLVRQNYRNASPVEICDWIDRGGARDYVSRFWTLDPIDGTKGFLRRDQYAISLALIIDGELSLGILACPNLGTKNQNGHSLFHAISGEGAFATRLDCNSESKRIHVASTSDPSKARYCESFESGHSSHSESAMIAEQLGIKSSPVRMDSQAKYATVADGEAEIYLRLPSKTGYFEKIWDHAGGVLIVQEAGGRVTDLQGKPLNFSLGRELRENRGVIVTNEALHSVVLETAQSITAKG
jgi:3'(2'), 5'-bisphosphate nucleotidase